MSEPETERRKHSRNLLREMRTRAQGWSALEIEAVIEVLRQELESDSPPACPPEAAGALR